MYSYLVSLDNGKLQNGGEYSTRKPVTDALVNYWFQTDVEERISNLGFTVISWGTFGGMDPYKWEPIQVKENATGIIYTSEDKATLVIPNKYKNPNQVTVNNDARAHHEPFDESKP